MEKLVNNIMNVAVVILSLSGVIACSEIEALKPDSKIIITGNGGNTGNGGYPQDHHFHINEVLTLTSASSNDATMYGILNSIPEVNTIFNQIAGPLRPLNYRLSLDITNMSASNVFSTVPMVLEVNVPDLGRQIYFTSSSATVEIEQDPANSNVYEITYGFSEGIQIYISLIRNYVMLNSPWEVRVSGSYVAEDLSNVAGPIGSVIAQDAQLK
jgi:hypothetical protein